MSDVCAIGVPGHCEQCDLWWNENAEFLPSEHPTWTANLITWPQPVRWML